MPPLNESTQPQVISGLLRAASATPPTRQTYSALLKLDSLVKQDDDLLVRALPVYLNHLSASKLLEVHSHPGDGEDRTRDVEEVQHAAVCLSGLVRPSPRCRGRLPGKEQLACEALIHASSSDILRWAAFFLERYFETPSQLFFVMFADVAIRSFQLLREDVLCSPEGFHLLLLSWLSEASNNRFRKLAHDHGTTVAIHMVIVLKRAITPTDPSRDDSCGKELLALVTDAADSIVRAAFRNLSLLELGSVPNVLLLKLLETSLQIICALALKLEASAAVFTPEEVTIVSRVFSFIACRGHDLQAPHHSDIAVQRAFRDSCSRIVQSCTTFLTWTLTDNVHAVVSAPTIQNGLLSGVLSGGYWLSDEFTDFMALRGAFRSKSDLLDFLGDELVRHLWIYSVFNAVAAAVQNMRDDIDDSTMTTHALYQDLCRLITRWQPMSLQVDTRTGPLSGRCFNSQCLLSGHTDLHLKTCGGCREAKFCSRNCQAAAWRQRVDSHRDVCLPRTRRASAGFPLSRTREIAFAQAIFAYELQLAGGAAELLKHTDPQSDEVLELRVGLEPVCGIAPAPSFSAENRELWSDMIKPPGGGRTVIITLPKSRYTSEKSFPLSMPA